MTTDRDLDTLRETLALQDLVNQYGHIVDDAAWDDLERVFAADGVCDFRPVLKDIPLMEGLDEIRDVFANAIEHPFIHYVTNIVVDLDLEAGRARVRSKFLTVARDRRPMIGEYHDEAVKTPAGWRLTRRAGHRPRKLAEALGQ